MLKKFLFFLLIVGIGGCALENKTPLANMENTYWKALSINGENVSTMKDGDELHFTILEGQARGSDGCNRFFLPVKIAGQKITFEHGGSTRKMCMEGMEQGQNFLDILIETTSWEIEGETLNLNKGDEVIGTFKAVYF